jgi:hypothetical protein
MDIDTFTPIGDTVNLSVSSSSARVQITASSSGSSNVRIHNKGTVGLFVTFGGSSVTATTAAGIPIPVGAIEIFGLGNYDYVAAITASGTATLYATPGQGA